VKSSLKCFRGVLFVIALTAVPVGASATEPDVLDGTWQLEHARSGSLDPILEKMGYGWIARQVMATLSVRQVIRTTPEGLSVRVITSLSDDIVVLPINNTWAVGRTLDGETTQRRSRWLESESALRTEDRYPQGLLTTTRVRVDSKTMHEVLWFQTPGKPRLRAVRVFRRR
jgi:hypothetical protein